MSWVGNGTESVFLGLLQDRGKQPGSGNPLRKALSKKEGQLDNLPKVGGQMSLLKSHNLSNRPASLMSRLVLAL